MCQSVEASAAGACAAPTFPSEPLLGGLSHQAVGQSPREAASQVAMAGLGALHAAVGS